MKLRILLAGVLVSLAPTLNAQQGGSCALGPLAPMGSETITVSSTAVGFTAGSIKTDTAEAIYAYGYVASDAIRYWDNGTTPTASVGMLVAAGANFEVCGAPAVRQFRMIRKTTDATVSVSYYQAR